jgi:hydroxymethylbilane synthase
LVIASRRSRLARAQAEWVGTQIAARDPALKIEYRWLESEADQMPDRPLADAGGKGLFARAIEQAVLEEQADLAVHSLKDLPAADGSTRAALVLAAVPVRADVRDCLISRGGFAGIDKLPQGAHLGTASPRRAAQVRRLRPDVVIDLIRGNIETRLRKVLGELTVNREQAAAGRGQGTGVRGQPDASGTLNVEPGTLNPAIPQGSPMYDASLMAVAGLHRAGLSQYAAYPIDTSLILPAACQGALALQCRAGDHVTLRRCVMLNDGLSAAAAHAERQIVAALHGDCHSPIAVLAEPIDPDQFRIRARVFSPDGRQCAEADERAHRRDTAKLVKRILALLEDRGAHQILAAAGA